MPIHNDGPARKQEPQSLALQPHSQGMAPLKSALSLPRPSSNQSLDSAIEARGSSPSSTASVRFAPGTKREVLARPRPGRSALVRGGLAEAVAPGRGDHALRHTHAPLRRLGFEAEVYAELLQLNAPRSRLAEAIAMSPDCDPLEALAKASRYVSPELQQAILRNFFSAPGVARALASRASGCQHHGDRPRVGGRTLNLASVDAMTEASPQHSPRRRASRRQQRAAAARIGAHFT